MNPRLSAPRAPGVVLVCLDPPLLRDALVRVLRHHGVEGVACPPVDRRHRPRTARRFGAIISDGTVPVDAGADVLITSPAGFAVPGEVNVRTGKGLSAIAFSELADVVEVTLRFVSVGD